MKYIVIHCSDSADHLQFTASDIHRWHIERGFDGIGYHYVIGRDGVLENGRPEYWIGAHVKGFNSESIGICLIGRTHFTDRQFNSLTDLVDALLLKYPNADVVGHRDLDPAKTCPNFDVQKWFDGR